MSKREEFLVMTDHILLLKRMYASWNHGEFGAPSIDCKRPYGNSDVIEDILSILQLEENDSNITYAKRLHKDMETVLQILVRNASEGIRPGVYITPKYRCDWSRKE